MDFKIPVINGDICDIKSDMIVQQCNCLTVRPHGLSQQIKEKLRVDPYGHRRLLIGRSNCAIKEDREEIGSVKIYCLKNKNICYVACLFAQFAPGKSGNYYKEICSEHINRLTLKPIIDNKTEREAWFQLCLSKLALRIAKLKCKNITFPYLIGCGLAGGDWSKYEKMITQWAHLHQNDFNVSFIKFK